MSLKPNKPKSRGLNPADRVREARSNDSAVLKAADYAEKSRQSAVRSEASAFRAEEAATRCEAAEAAIEGK